VRGRRRVDCIARLGNGCAPWESAHHISRYFHFLSLQLVTRAPELRTATLPRPTRLPAAIPSRRVLSSADLTLVARTSPCSRQLPWLRCRLPMRSTRMCCNGFNFLISVRLHFLILPSYFSTYFFRLVPCPRSKSGFSSTNSSAGTVWNDTTTQSASLPTTGRCHVFGGIEIHLRSSGASGSLIRKFDCHLNASPARTFMSPPPSRVIIR